MINQIAGAPAPDMPLIARPVHVYYYEAGPAREHDTKLVLALFAFEQLAPNDVEEWFRANLKAHGYAAEGRLEFKICKVYSKSAQERMSFPHHRLLVDLRSYLGWRRQTLFHTLQLYFYTPGVPAPSASRPGASNDKTAARTSSKNAKEAKQNHIAGDGAKGVPAAGKPDDSSSRPAAPASPASPVNPSVAALNPAAPGPNVVARPSEVPRRSLRRYPRPDYKGGAEPLLTTEPLRMAKETAKRAVFAVEEIQCGEDGNWLVGYMGQLQSSDGDSVSVLLTQRHALNNYPGQRVATLEKLRTYYAVTGGLECDPGQRECHAPAFEKQNYGGYRQALLAARKGGAGLVSDVPRYSCRPDKGICISPERDHWRCNLDGNCLSYDPTRWWCAWRQEFCFSRVKFGDWASPIKENDIVEVKLDGTGRHLVYDMSDGFLRIAQDALTRVCGSGETKVWKAHWAGPK